MKTFKTACLFAPALALACGAALAAPDDAPDALLERSSPGNAAAPFQIQPNPVNAMSPEWERRLSRTSRPEADDSAVRGGSSRSTGTTERMVRPRSPAWYEDERPAPWSNSPY